MMKTKYTTWTEIEWDGNSDLKLRCWRKSFGHGHVSVGIGDFLHIVYSHGANSVSSTRWRKDAPPMSEHEAMTMVDKNHGHYRCNFR